MIFCYPNVNSSGADIGCGYFVSYLTNLPGFKEINPDLIPDLTQLNASVTKKYKSNSGLGVLGNESTSYHGSSLMLAYYLAMVSNIFPCALTKNCYKRIWATGRLDPTDGTLLIANVKQFSVKGKLVGFFKSQDSLFILPETNALDEVKKYIEDNKAEIITVNDLNTGNLSPPQKKYILLAGPNDLDALIDRLFKVKKTKGIPLMIISLIMIASLATGYFIYPQFNDFRQYSHKNPSEHGDSQTSIVPDAKKKLPQTEEHLGHESKQNKAVVIKSTKPSTEQMSSAHFPMEKKKESDLGDNRNIITSVVISEGHRIDVFNHFSNGNKWVGVHLLSRVIFYDKGYNILGIINDVSGLNAGLIHTEVSDSHLFYTKEKIDISKVKEIDRIEIEHSRTSRNHNFPNVSGELFKPLQE